MQWEYLLEGASAGSVRDEYLIAPRRGNKLQSKGTELNCHGRPAGKDLGPSLISCMSYAKAFLVLNLHKQKSRGLLVEFYRERPKRKHCAKTPIQNGTSKHIPWPLGGNQVRKVEIHECAQCPYKRNETVCALSLLSSSLRMQ
jgi:hypothetical protein